MFTIRPICMEDAPAFLRLCLQLDEETKFMLLEPGERTLTVEDQGKRIESILASGNQMIFVAEAEGVGPVGYLAAYGGTYRRNRGTAHIVIGILQAYAGMGLGARLFEAAEGWARSWGARRLELTVMAHNQRAVRLYQKMGYVIEGTKRDSLCVDGVYIDEYYMGKILQ